MPLNSMTSGVDVPDDPPKFVPKLWHGRRVIVEKEPPPPKPAP